MTVLPSPEAMIVICTVILIAYTAHVLNKAFASSEQFEAMLSARDRIIGLETENAKLRELCTALYRCCDKMSECETCEDVACPFMDDCRLHDRMCELGVEL